METDYLVVGAGAVGMAFVDTLLDETDAHITLVDRRAKPGGHWVDTYPFVALHQPSAYYGVNSTALGSSEKDVVGLNAGFHGLASGSEVAAYYDRVLQQKLMASGRVHYLPMHAYVGGDSGQHAEVVSILSGKKSSITIRRKFVDANYSAPEVPAIRKPKYSVADNIHVVPPNALPNLWRDAGTPEFPSHFAIVGAGKTAMDVGVWLLNHGASPDAITWVMPRDSWVLNRASTQPGDEFFHQSIGGQVALFEAFAGASSIQDLFLRLEASEQMFRIYPDQTPSMFHFATISQGEVALLRKIQQVIRKGRVQGIDNNGLILDQGRHAMPTRTLYIDCTASAVEPRKILPIFQGAKIVPQLVRAPQPAFSAAMVAYVEAHFSDDDKKNKLCGVVPFPYTLADYPKTMAMNMTNQMVWRDEKALREWMLHSRLDGFTKTIAFAEKNDPAKQAVLENLKTQMRAAMANMPRLLHPPTKVT